MARVVGIDHLVIRVGDLQRSKIFYGRLFAFLGFKMLDEYGDAIGWTNGKTRFWVGQAAMRRAGSTSPASATSASTTMPSRCAAAATSMSFIAS